MLYSKWISKDYWEEHGVKAPAETPITKEKLRLIQKSVEEGLCPVQRWKTVRDAIGDLPDPTKPYDTSVYRNHEHRPGARIYAGHSGSIMDEPSKTIKAGAHGVPGGENTVVLDDGTIRYYTVRESARIQTFPVTICSARPGLRACARSEMPSPSSLLPQSANQSTIKWKG